MTVIAWDGKTLAADSEATSGYVRGTTNKIFQISENGSLVGLSGDHDCCMALLVWLRGGRNANDWPNAAQSSTGWARAMEIKPGGNVVYYEKHPYPLIIRMSFHAIGAGRECAIGAMAAGASAVRAVEIASEFVPGCGGGIDTLTF